jgi:hypothetical protein
MASQSRTNLKSWMLKTIAAGFAAFPLSLLVVVSLFVLADTGHADILVSNFHSGSVGKYYDDGTVNTLDFLQGAASAEGVQCVKLTSNEVYVAAANSPTIGVYNLTTGGPPVSTFTVVGPTRFVALAMNADASVLYGADTYSGLWAVNLPIGTPNAPCTPALPCHAGTTFWDVTVGPDGNVYASNRGVGSSGVTRFPPVGPTGWTPGAGVVVIRGDISYGGHSLTNAGAMVFDGAGNLWVNNSSGSTDEGTFEFTGPQNPNPFKLLNFTADPHWDQYGEPLGMDISPVNPPSPPFDPCKGCIVIAEFMGNDVNQIDPTTCTGTVANPGTCQFYGSAPFITDVNGPKYVRFIENCNDTGYLEICKMSCLTNPVSGYFNFTATNQDFNSGPLSIPVNACSGPIQVPNGTVTIKETQQLGVQVTGIAAYNYDYLGNPINALLSSNRPFTTGNVDVVSGDVSTETVAGFTNCASGPGELKICKVAGDQDLQGTNFVFEVFSGYLALPIYYNVLAGPPPGGYCAVAGSYPVGTQVFVSEPFLPIGVMASNISVAPADRGGRQVLGGGGSFFAPSVIAVIDSGTTEVTFTNVDTR